MSTHARTAHHGAVLSLFCGCMLASSGCARAQKIQLSATKNLAVKKVVTPKKVVIARPMTSQAKAEAAWTKLKSLYDYDRTTPLDAKTLDTQTSTLGTTRRMTIRGSRGETIPIIIVMPVGASAQNKVPGLVLLHGKGDALGEVLMLFIARSAASHGYASLIPEVVDHDAAGNHKVTPFSGDAARLRKAFIESIQDVRRSLDLFNAQPEIDAKRVGLIGLSLGGIMGSVTTSVDKRISTAIFVVGGADWPTILGGSEDPDAHDYRARFALKSALERKRENQTLEAIDPKNFVAHIAPRPILLINGTKDVLIPKAAAQALFSAAREPKKQIWLPYGHFLSAEIRPIMQDWIDAHLGGVAPKTPAPADAGASVSTSVPTSRSGADALQFVSSAWAQAHAFLAPRTSMTAKRATAKRAETPHHDATISAAVHATRSRRIAHKSGAKGGVAKAGAATGAAT